MYRAKELPRQRSQATGPAADLARVHHSARTSDADATCHAAESDADEACKEAEWLVRLEEGIGSSENGRSVCGPATDGSSQQRSVLHATCLTGTYPQPAAIP